MGVCYTVCRNTVNIAKGKEDDEDRRRLELVSQINAKKQKKVPHLEIDINPMFLQRKMRENRLSQSS